MQGSLVPRRPKHRAVRSLAVDRGGTLGKASESPALHRPAGTGGAAVSSRLSCELLAPDDARWMTLLDRVSHDFYHLPSYVQMCARIEHGEAGAFHVADGGNELLLPMIVREVP